MDSTVRLICFLSLLFFISPSIAKPSFQPRVLVLPVTKDSSSLQYLTVLNRRTPLVPVKLTVDLGGEFLWEDCEQGYLSSSYRPVRCHSAQCSLARSRACGNCFAGRKPGCNNNTCALHPYNPITHVTNAKGELAQDVVSIQSTDGSKPSRAVSLPFLFACAPTVLLKGLAGGAKGMAGLGRTRIAFPSQFVYAFNFPRKFAVCLSSSTVSSGVIFFGNGPYVLRPKIDVTKFLTYTPLINNPVSTAGSHYTGEPSAEYFIGVKSIKVNNKIVPINASLLSINKDGTGGTKISTTNPYTIMETSIYKAFTVAFIKETTNYLPRVASVAPFEACFRSMRDTRSVHVGLGVPMIALGLQSKSVYWGIFGVNSMVYVSSNIVCLGFVDGGNARTSIVIGAHQIEDNLLQFDLEKSRLGFSSLLTSRDTSCADFSFTPT
ncbi:hypothetical protein RJ639_035332 [Escallonia herrerae]|uniref:Peptidase A1 domain-containing protein n=1 Tax=Escallonia herrerae TaxID=1293975 RepID=A0AA88X2G3_9ASTE|nr:hypothetical protein RJ639_035332 [Escallonia herrerae]